MLGHDNGLVNYSVGFWTHEFSPMDRVPNGAMPPASVPIPEITALDNCAGVIISRSGVPANNLFPVGETLVTYTATDAGGHTASVTQTVNVVDGTPPTISNAAATPSMLWPPNRDMVDVVVSYDAADNCAVLETKLSVSSNDATGSGKETEWEIVDAHHVRLRAKRSARGRARLYTITITAQDVHGNVSSQSVTVNVAQSKGREF